MIVDEYMSHPYTIYVNFTLGAAKLRLYYEMENV